MSYGRWPGGACPAGFCVNPLPVHVGCWPPGSLPPLFVQDGGLIFAEREWPGKKR